MKIDNLQKLLVDELKDIYDAEHQLLDALPKMSEAASSPELKQAFTQHRQETQGQVRRLEQVFRGLGKEPERKTCEGMKGLLEEGKEFLEADGDKDAIDAALIGAAQKVEHYEMATYGTLRTFALTLGRRDEAQLLQETLDEEAAADEKLTDIAISGVNPEATEGNGHSGGRLAGLLSSLGIRSRSASRPASGGRGASKKRSGARQAAGSKSAGSRGGAKSAGSPSRSAASKGGSKGRGGAKKASAKRSAASRGGAKASRAGSSKTRSTSGARKSGARKSGARKSGGSKSRGSRSGSR